MTKRMILKKLIMYLGREHSFVVEYMNSGNWVNAMSEKYNLNLDIFIIYNIMIQS
jgi:hypothetical protein